MTATKQKPDGRGGKRPGAGRKPGVRESLSVRQIKEMRDAAAAKAKECGKTLYDILLQFAYDEDLPVKDRQASIKLFIDKMHIAVSEGGEADKMAGMPAVYLPEHRGKILELIKKAE